MSTLSQIGYSGVHAAQTALASTGQNIANANTPGFSRLNALFASRAGSSALNAGGGVEVTSIRRLSNEFLSQQLWRANSEQHFFESNQQYLGALEGLMGGEGSSISVGLDQFFAALSEASPTPSSLALRQQILSEAGNLAQRFNGLNGNIQAQLDALHEQRQAMVAETNGLIGNIAELNKRIIETESVKGDSNALRDQRENLTQQLSRFAALRINEVADGSYTIALTNGQPLVVGATAARLDLSLDASNQQSISLAFAGTQFPLRQDSFGGALGGLYSSEYNSLRPMQGALHQMADQLAQRVNGVMSAGFDLAGNPGQALFTYDAASTTQMLRVETLSAEQLAFSDSAGEQGNNGNLLDLLDLKSQGITLNGSAFTLNDAYASLLGRVASDSRQSKADLQTTTAVTQQAQAQRDSVSAVNLDEEAVSLMTYQQAYQANMKVIATARDIFEEMLASF